MSLPALYQQPQIQQVYQQPQEVYYPPQPIQVYNPFTPRHRFSAVIHGNAKIGKSTTAATAPKPILVLDGEGSWRFIAMNRTIEWDPMTQPVPVYDGTWDVCVVIVHDWGIVNHVLNILRTQPLPFISVVLDSITEIQRRLKAIIFRQSARDPRQLWGSLLDDMTETIRGFRDLCMIPQVNVRCLILVAETEFSAKHRLWVPAMQGKISDSLPFWFDTIGYLYLERRADQNTGVTIDGRTLWIGPSDQFQTGSRLTRILGPCLWIDEPPLDPRATGYDVEKWMRTAFQVWDTAPQPALAVTPSPAQITDGRNYA